MDFLPILSLIFVLTLWIAQSVFLNRRLTRSKKRYHQFFDDSPVALIVIDKHYRILEWNQTAETIFGWDSFDAEGESILDLIVPPVYYEHVETVLQNALSKGISYSKNYNITKHQNKIFCEWRNRRLEGDEGEILCIAQDITVSQKSIDELTKRSAALESAGDAILYTNEKGIIEFANHAFFDLKLNNGYQLYGSHIGTYLFEKRLAFTSLHSQFDTDHTWKGTITKSSDNGDKVLSVTIKAIYHDERLVSYIANLHDITLISSHMDDLNHRVQHDFLTGAVNRATLYARLEHAITHAKRSGEKIALFFIDLNDFKQVNDTYGHDAGDKLLSDVSQNLIASLRTTDTVSRYGGDEFVILCEEVKGEDHIHTIRATIEMAISEPVWIDADTALTPHASIGTAIYPNTALTAEELIRSADFSMYTAKKQKNDAKPMTRKTKKCPSNEPVLALFADSHSH